MSETGSILTPLRAGAASGPARRGLPCLLPLAALLTGGCNTNLRLLELKRDQLLGIEKAAVATRDLSVQGRYDPGRYDLYLMLNSKVFDQLLSGFDNSQIVIGDKRPIDITLGSIRMAFRPGYPDLTLVATARDRKSGLEAQLDLDVRLLIEGDPGAPGTLYLKPVATRIVPRLKWGALDFARWRFARRLMELQASRLTERIPRVEIPVQNEFVIGGKGGTKQVRIDTGEGYIMGNVAYPSTELGAAISVKEVLFLRNGIHVFANVEGL